MNKILFVILTIVIVFSLQCPAIGQTEPQSGPKASQEGPSIGAKVADVALVRPLCLVGSTISTAVYLVISPFAYAMGVGEPAARAMVEAPWRFTAFRHIGEFDHYTDEKPITGVWEFY
ncbi:MAG: hypothetical protein A4E65_02826 [Syntrophorhabdus sp. PtaU1.Bin153]|nr:MAG: hypothetical protein A4E65_02826 [Syntrophorhabdus sp. PtaU1.Bin153]